MADNVGYTPGSGATIAADDIGGVLYQRVKITHGADGIAHETSNGNPLPTEERGELLEAIEALRMAAQSLSKTIGFAMPDTAGRIRILAESPTAANLQTTATIASGTVTTVSTVSTVTNQSQAGTFAMQDHIPALMHLQADSLRRNIAVT
jgi:hypothetical protein